MGNELIRIDIGYFQPGDICYESLLLNQDWNNFTFLKYDGDLDDCYRLDDGWILDAARKVSALGDSAGDIRVRLLKPVTVYWVSVVLAPLLSEQISDSGYEDLYSDFLDEFDILARPVLCKKNLYAYPDALSSLAEASTWASFITLWECGYYRCGGWEYPEEYDFDYGLLGRFDINHPGIKTIVGKIKTEETRGSRESISAVQARTATAGFETWELIDSRPFTP